MFFILPFYSSHSIINNTVGADIILLIQQHNDATLDTFVQDAIHITVDETEFIFKKHQLYLFTNDLFVLVDHRTIAMTRFLLVRFAIL